MKHHKLTVTLAMAALASLAAINAFSQDMGAEKAAQPAASEAVTQPKEISIYGEVKATTPASNSMSVQYYDYDKDEELTLEIVLAADTKIENAADLAGIKQGNWVDCIYTVKDGKSVAKSIVVEKEEEAPAEEPAPLPEEE